MRFRSCFLSGMSLALAAGAAGATPPAIDPALPSYQPQGVLRGELHSVGSDVMDVVTLGWLELLRAAQPKIAVTMEARAPASAIPALVTGWAQVGPVGRELYPHEEQQFVEKFGYPPTAIRVATASFNRASAASFGHVGSAQTIAFFVNEHVPLTSLSLDQVREIFVKGGAITKWGQLGLTGDWAERPIELWGLKRPNGIVNYLEARVLEGKECRAGINERINQDDVPALDAITTGVANSPYALGYSGLSSARSGVKILALAEHNGEPAVGPTLENVSSHQYPLARFIYIYVNRPPGKPLDPNVREFLRLVLSREGQEVVARQGLFLPLTATIAREEVSKLD
jgi:phosphate transport system substrate-binding protein